MKIENMLQRFSCISFLFKPPCSHGRLDSVQKFIEIQGWLLLTFFIYLHNQLSSSDDIIVHMSEKHDSSSRQ